jgi:Flp pilus assembly pilin Flp
MKKMTSRLKNRRGQGLVEYVLAVVLMALLCVGAVKYLGTKTHNAFVQAGDQLDKQMTYSDQNGQGHGTLGN